MYEVSVVNTPENFATLISLGINFFRSIPNAEYIGVALYAKTGHSKYCHNMDAPLVDIEHVAPMLMMGVKQNLHYAIAEGIIKREDMDVMTILDRHKI